MKSMISVAPLRANRGMLERWVCASCRSHSLRQSRKSFFAAIHALAKPKSISSRQLPTPNRRPIAASFRRCYSTRSTNTASSNSATTRQPRLPATPARTRFAPSPTGYLHIGGLRTALLSYLLAKRTRGQFLLRIEDTDQKRLVPDAEAKLCADLQWAGLQWDEGPEVGGPYGPYRQSERTQIYHQHAEELLERGSAYRCFCSPQAAGGAQRAYVTSGCYQSCSSLSSEESQEWAETRKRPFTVRLRQPEDAHKRVYPDLVYGTIQRLRRSPATAQSASEDDSAGIDAGADTILIKSDGTPTYHFANVVDDRLMEITHVIRGSEWAASTPLHYDIYSAFGWEPPEFAHVGLLVDRNGAKLSKRNADLALDVATMREQFGVLPDTLNNFLALLGWSNPTQNDVMDMQTLVRNFDLKFTRGNAMVRMEKLWFLQKQHVKQRCEDAAMSLSKESIADLVAQIKAEVQRSYTDPIINRNLILNPNDRCTADSLSAYCTHILLADSKNYTNAREWIERHRYFFAWDPAQVPEEKEFYDKVNTLRAELLRKCARGVVESGFQSVPGSKFSSRADYQEISINAALKPRYSNHGTNPSPVDAMDSDPREYTLAHLTLGGVVIKAGSSLPDERTGKPSFKDEGVALMKFLREKLAYGLPGPSMSMVMALLGESECRRRLGMEPKQTG